VPLCRHKALSSNPVQPKPKKIFGAEEVAQWENVCPACAKPWIQFPNMLNKKKMVRKISGINVTSAIS
jgi:hypothetical protein